MEDEYGDSCYELLRMLMVSLMCVYIVIMGRMLSKQSRKQPTDTVQVPQQFQLEVPADEPADTVPVMQQFQMEMCTDEQMDMVPEPQQYQAETPTDEQNQMVVPALKLNKSARVCFNCRGQGHYASKCPERKRDPAKKTCFICNQRGHFASKCSSRKEARIRRNSRNRVAYEQETVSHDRYSF